MARIRRLSPTHPAETTLSRTSSCGGLCRHAVTDDLTLKRWSVLTRDAPLIGTSERAPDGVENVAVFRGPAGRYVMIYSEGLVSQHLAHAVSDDLIEWSDRGPLQIRATQRWLAGRYGAPFVWRQPAGASPFGAAATDSAGAETADGVGVADGAAGVSATAERGGCFWMALMGEAEIETHASFIGLLHSTDGAAWNLLPERNASRASTAGGQLTTAPTEVAYTAGGVEPEGLATTGAVGGVRRVGGAGVLLTDSGEARTLVVRRRKVPATRREVAAKRSTPHARG